MQKTLKRQYLASVEKQFGKELTAFADDDSGGVKRLPLGIGQFDWLTLGGLPLEKLILFRGPEGGTKTTHAVIACARYLNRFPKEMAVYIDLEEKYPLEFARRMGVDKNRFSRMVVDSAEKTIDLVEFTLKRKQVGLLVVDSIAAMLPRIEKEASAEDWQQGLAARLINKMIRKMVGGLIVAKSKWGKAPTIILINQERLKFTRFGDPTTLPGGEGQKFAVSLNVRFRTMNPRKEDEVPTDAPLVKVGATIYKHSFGPKGKAAEYLLSMKNFSLLNSGDALDQDFVRGLATKLGFILRNGNGWKVLGKTSSNLDSIAHKKPPYQELKEAILKTLEEEL